MARLVLLAMFVATSAHADTYSDRLASGRALEGKGKHAEAAAAFEAALHARTDDPTALAELGWVQFELKDLKHAEASTRAALAKLPADSGSPELSAAAVARGGALYNLGRILEDGGDKPGAIKAYRDAHAVYPRAVVRDQVAKLDAAAAAELEPYRPQAMKGPFATIAAFCASVRTKSADCTCGSLLADEGKGKLARPFEQVAVFARQGCDDAVDQELDLAVKVATGWYVAAATPDEWNNSAQHCELATWHFKDASLANAVLRLDYTSTATCETKGSNWGWDEHSTIAIGIGPSKAPSATPPVTAKHDMLPEHTHVIAATLIWAPGSVTVAGKFADKATSMNLAGKHVLVFR